MSETPGNMDILRFLPHPRIIAVDNREDHLNRIKDGLFKLGLPCITMLYDLTEGLAKPERWNGERLRVIFLDLNLNEVENLSSETVASLVGPIGDALRDLKLEGPYLVIFWTHHQDYVEDTMRLLAEREEDLLLPFAFTTIDKNLFIPPPGVEQNLKGLQDAIKTALLNFRLFLSILAWESEVEGAAVRTFNKVYSLLKRGQVNGEDRKEADLQGVMKILAMAAWGKTNAMKEPGASIASGLAPLLLDHLDSIIGNEDYTQIWKEAISDEWEERYPEGVSPASLNARCLVDMNSKNRGFRGIWLEFSQEALNREPHHSQLCLRAASKSWTPTGVKLKRYRPGRTTQTNIARKGCSRFDFHGKKRQRGPMVQLYQRDPIGLFQECFSKTRDELVEEFIKPKSNSPDVSKIRNSVHLGIVDFTAACDYNNDNAPLRRFVLCARIPAGIWKARKQEKLFAAIYPVGLIAMEEGEFYLFMNFRYAPSLPDNHPLLAMAEPILRVRSQVLTDIADRYAAHTTRVGTLSFGKKI